MLLLRDKNKILKEAMPAIFQPQIAKKSKRLS